MKENCIFINKLSIEQQFDDNWKDAIESLLSNTVFKLDSLMVKFNYFMSSTIYLKDFLRNGNKFSNVLLLDKDIKMRFNQFTEKCFIWDYESFQSNSDYYEYETNIFISTSLGECYEYNTLCDTLLYNFKNSSFKEPTIPVLKNSLYLSDLNSISNDVYLNKFLMDLGIDVNYNDSYTYSPRDFQTVLINEDLFTLTIYFNRKRKVYIRNGADEYWCVDNFHYGKSAHLEVFNMNTKKHKGTCKINGDLVIKPSSGKNAKKTINLDEFPN